MGEFLAQLWANSGFKLIATGVTAWMVVSFVLNWAFWFKTPEKWVEFAEKYPTSAKLIKLLRKLGVNPVGALKTLKEKVDANATPNPLPMPPSKEEKKE